MAASMFVFSGADTLAKLLTEALHPIQITWSRQFGLLIGVLILMGIRGLSVLRTRHPTLQITRGVLTAGSATLFITAVSFVPLADAISVTFMAPFMITILGAMVLREPVGVRRWSAVVIGFLGAIIIIRPGLGVVHPAMMLVVLAAGFFALRQILTRMLSGSDRAITTFAYTALGSCLVLTVPLPFVWQWPSTTVVVALLAGMAGLAALGELLVIKALEAAQAVVIAPVQYTLLIWATMYGYLVFAQLPEMWTWVGALIIIATGVYTLHREHLVARRA